MSSSSLACATIGYKERVEFGYKERVEFGCKERVEFGYKERVYVTHAFLQGMIYTHTAPSTPHLNDKNGLPLFVIT